MLVVEVAGGRTRSTSDHFAAIRLDDSRPTT